MGLSYNFKQAVKWFLFILFIGYYGSILLFTHTHIINGVTIVHSHPYKPFSESGTSNHSHSSNEIVVLQALSHFLLTLVFLYVSLTVYRVLVEALKTAGYHFNKFLKAYYTFLLRAPPFKYS